MRDHGPRRDLLSREEQTLQVGVEHQIPILGGDVDGELRHVDARVVHEDVDSAKHRHHPIDHLVNHLEPANVESQNHCAPSSLLDCGGCLFRSSLFARQLGEPEIGPCVGKSDRNGASQPRPGSSDERDPVVDATAWEHRERVYRTVCKPCVTLAHSHQQDSIEKMPSVPTRSSGLRVVVLRALFALRSQRPSAAFREYRGGTTRFRSSSTGGI